MIKAPQKLLPELRNYIKNKVSLEDYFVCVYGSYATKHFGKNSDLDIFFATKSYKKEDYVQIRDYIISLHKKYGLKIDEEVPYSNKLLVLYEDIESATRLKPFLKNGYLLSYNVPKIKKGVKFLKSKEVRLRLILNALTTPHIFIFGNRLKYKALKKRAEYAIIRLAIGLAKKKRLGGNDILNSLLRGRNGESGQAHLGYKSERVEVVTHLKKIIKERLNLKK